MDSRNLTGLVAEPPAFPAGRPYCVPASAYREGLLVGEMTRGVPHFVATLLLMKALEGVTPAGCFVGKKDPVALPSGHPSVPGPDVSVFRGEVRDSLNRRPGPADVALVAEVSDGSVREGRMKLGRYGWEGVPVARLADVSAGVVVGHSLPSGRSESPGYRECRAYGRGEEVPVVSDGREVGRVAAGGALP